MSTYLTTVVEDRWNEANASPTIARWRTLAAMAAQLADAIEEHDPDNIMVVAHRAVYEAAYARMIAMQPKKSAA